MNKSANGSRPATILIVEADDVAATVLQDELRGAGYVVPRAGSTHETLRTLESMPADLVLLSLVLPDSDGLMLCSALRARYAVPIIALSARPGEVDRTLARELGAIDCLTTPIDPTELLARVHAAVHTRCVRNGSISRAPT